MNPITILRIDSSPRGSEAHCGRLADELQQRLEFAWPHAKTVRRSVFEQPPPYVDIEFTRYMTTHTTAQAAAEIGALSASEELIGELERAAALIIATPMHNYTVPAPLKAWLDQIVRFGRTFASTPQGKIGKLSDRPAFVVVSSGGYFSGSDARQPDFLTPYLTAILQTIGITSPTFIRMEGLSRGQDKLEAAYTAARSKIASLELELFSSNITVIKDVTT